MLYAISMRFSKQKWLKNRMDIAYAMFFRLKTRLHHRYSAQHPGRALFSGALALCVVFCAPAHADDERVLGASLLNWLNSGSDAAVGAAYIYGVVDTAKAQRRAAKLPERICLPTSMEEAQMADLVRRYLNANTPRLEAGASALVLEALEKTLPCK
jgi:hypothetical protein